MFLPHTGRHYFNPRSPHGERRAVRKVKILKVRISIHAPRTGSDGSYFQIPHTMGISIHAPRTGSDGFTTLMLCGCVNFNPRSPHGERRRPLYSFACSYLFQSTLPARGATCSCRCCFARAYLFQSTLPARGATAKRRISPCVPRISIHAPRTGSDRTDNLPGLQRSDISIHAPRTGSDSMA